MGDRVRRPRRRRVAQHRMRPRVRGRQRVGLAVWLGHGVPGEGLHHPGAARLRAQVGRRQGRPPPPPDGQPARVNPFDGEQVAKYVAGLRGRRSFEDSLGICIFTSRTRLESICRALSAATGWTFTVDEALRFGRRTAAINRATALRCGHTGAMEYPSTRYGSTPVDGPAKGQAIRAQWEKMLDTWYAEVGFDRKTGRPWPKTLKGLGLDWLAKDLWGKKA